MAFPSPSDKQAKVLWFSLTVLAIAVFLALLALMFYGVGWMLDRLSPVLLPLAIAGILAFLLNPLVDFFEPKMSAKVSMLFSKMKNPKRVKAILLVFMIGVTSITTITIVIISTVDLWHILTLTDFLGILLHQCSSSELSMVLNAQ